MAKLPPRQKIAVLVFRRAAPADEVLLVPREIRRILQWALPSGEPDMGENAQQAALAIAERFVKSAPLGAPMDLGIDASYRVKDGPRAGEWTERFFAVEMPPDREPFDGRWLTHYDAKALAGAEAPRVREAFTKLRALARLKP